MRAPSNPRRENSSRAAATIRKALELLSLGFTCHSSTGRLMKYTGLVPKRQIRWDPRQPVLQKPDDQVVHVVGRLFLYRMPCPRHAQERGARDAAGQGTTHSKGDPPVLLPPQDHGRSHNSIEPPLQAVEVELSKGGPKSSPVAGQGDRSVILIHVGLCHLARLKIGGPEQTGGEAPPAERDHCRSEHGPPGYAKQQRLTGTEAGRADQDEPA